MMRTNLMNLFLFLALILSSCVGNNTQKKTENAKLSGDVIIFHAGSLSVPFKQMKAEFEKLHPEVNLVMESAGSRKCARKISDLNRACDIMASADYTVIDKLLIPDYADFNIKFATNEMALVYHEASRHSEEINSDNWYEVLLKEDVDYGRSDPNADPCGYRAVLTSKLAEKHYNKEGLAEQILSKSKNYIRPKETDLLALLESNTIDYIFLYRSVAEQHGLKYVLLPDEVNLKKPELADFYKQATVEISGKKPGEFITKKGQPMVYGVTLVKNAPNKPAAMEFMKFILDKQKGMAIMKKNGQPSAVPSTSETFDKIPEALKSFAKPVI